METHCIIGENTLLAQGLHHYLTFQRKASVLTRSFSNLGLSEEGGINNIEFVWIDVVKELEALRKLCKRMLSKYPHSRVLVFGDFRDTPQIKALFKVGISAYFLPNCGIKDIVEGIARVADGNTYLDPQLARVLVQDLLQSPKAPRTSKQKLTKREKQILQLIVQEHTTQEIANKLFISFCTVETHRLHLIQKMGVRNTAGLVREAVSANLFD